MIPYKHKITTNKDSHINILSGKINAIFYTENSSSDTQCAEA